MQAVILAAGEGSRLQPVTNFVPKPLIPFWGRAFITYLLDNLEGLVDEAIIVGGPDGQVAGEIGDRRGSLPVHYACQPIPLGTGDAVIRAQELLEGPFLLLLGDTLATRETLEGVVEAPGDVVLTVIEVDDPENHLGVSRNGAGRVASLWTDDAMVDAGVFRLDQRIFDALDGLPPLRGELRVLQGIDGLLTAGADVRAVQMPGPWLQFGDHEGLAGVLRVMRQLGEMHGHECGPGASCVMVPAEGCTIENSLIFGPGSLKDSTIKDSIVYCATDTVGAAVTGAIETLT